MLFIDITICIACFIYNHHLLITILNFTVLSNDLICFIIILRTRVGTLPNRISSFLKFLFIIRSFIHLVYTSEIYIESNLSIRKIYFLQIFYQHLIVSAGIYLTFYKPSLYFGIFISTGNLSCCIYASIRTKDNQLEFMFEIATCILSYLVVVFKTSMIKSQNKEYANWKTNYEILEYFENLIDNLHIQTITYLNSKCISFNKSFKSSFGSYFKQNDQQSGSELKSNDNKFLVVEIEQNAINRIFTEDLLEYKVNTSVILNLNQVISNLSAITENNTFKLIGVFTNRDKTRFYNISYRLVLINNYDKLMDILIDEFTSIKQAEVISSETKVKQKLFSKFAHEFKTPLLVMKSLSNEFARIENNSIENLSKLSNQISSLSDYITFLISDIIYYSNSENIPIEKDEIDIKEILLFSKKIGDSLASVLPGFRNTVIEVIYDQRIDYYKVVSNNIKLKQVLLNFISNAVKFTKQGLIIISAFIEESNDNLVISVKDTGIGIKKEMLNEINSDFNDKLKIDFNKDYNEMGSGLGLGIVK